MENNHQTIVIQSDGTTTTATLLGIGGAEKTATAKRNPDDTFNLARGATLAINRLMFGTDYHPDEVALTTRKAEEEPERLLYCVKEFEPGEWLTKGEVYPIQGGFITYDDGYTPPFDRDNLLDGGLVLGHYCVELVRRPAKAGEWVRIIEDNGGPVVAGSIWSVARVEKCGALKSADGWSVRRGNYLVLDGYQPEPEYWSGKAVCIKSANDFLTAGRVYVFKDGLSVDDDGDQLPGDPIKGISELSERLYSDFIEYKGGSEDV